MNFQFQDTQLGPTYVHDKALGLESSLENQVYNIFNCNAHITWVLALLQFCYMYTGKSTADSAVFKQNFWVSSCNCAYIVAFIAYNSHEHPSSSKHRVHL